MATGRMTQEFSVNAACNEAISRVVPQHDAHSTTCLYYYTLCKCKCSILRCNLWQCVSTRAVTAFLVILQRYRPHVLVLGRVEWDRFTFFRDIWPIVELISVLVVLLCSLASSEIALLLTLIVN